MNVIIGRLGGKKFIVALFGLVAVVVAAISGIDIKPYENAFMSVIASFLVGQGVADGLSGGKTSSVSASADADAEGKL